MSNARQSVSMPTQSKAHVPEPQQQLPEGSHQRKLRNRRISVGGLSIAFVILSITALARADGRKDPTLSASPAPMLIGTYRLAYERRGEIYVAGANGRNPVHILPSSTGSRCDSWGGPSWAPDGRYVAFRCRSPWTVTIADPRGRIVSSFRVGMGWHVAWSPDSTQVAVWARKDDSPGGRRTIAVYGIDGALQKLLSVPRFSGDYDPSWSPDGRSIFVSALEIPVDGGPPRIAPAGDVQALCCPIAYSPDGTHAAFISGTSSALVVSPIIGSTGVVHVADDVQGAVWSPTGDRIAYGVRQGEGYDIANAGPVTEIRTVDVASGTVTSVLTAGSGYVVNVLGFSPDGLRILYCRMDAFSKRDGHRHWQLWGVGVDGSDPRFLAKGADLGEWQP
jgi:hypothetical protein